MHRLVIAVSIAVAARASAAPEIASSDPEPVHGRIVYVNDDDFDFTSLVGDTIAATASETNYEVGKIQVVTDPQRRVQLLRNCCGDHGAAETGTVSRSVDIDALVDYLDHGGNVVLLDDGNELAPVIVDLLERYYGNRRCLRLPSSPVHWVDGRTRYWITNAEVDQLAACVQATSFTITRDRSEAGRGFAITRLPGHARAQLAR